MIEINTRLAERLVAEQFPQWAHLSIHPVQPGGHDNRTFHLGTDKTLRLPSAEHYAAQAPKEWRWLRVLRPHLPLPIPVPLALGQPGAGFPWAWTICPWLGETASPEGISDRTRFALDLAGFLQALQAIDAAEGPAAGEHNFYRGGDLSVYDAQTREALLQTRGLLPQEAPLLLEIWERALGSHWKAAPVWVHGDVALTNLLAAGGKLSGVIDFGSSGVGDPACDLVIAWTFFSGDSRQAFRDAMGMERDVWDRARGWALWKALITVAAKEGQDPVKSREALRVIDAVTDDLRRETHCGPPEVT